MKFLKGVLIVLGLVALAVGGYFFFRTWVDTGRLVAVANANQSSQGYASPWRQTALTVGLGTLGGLVLGFGLGLPRRLAGGIRKDALEAANLQREQEIRSRAFADADRREAPPVEIQR